MGTEIVLICLKDKLHPIELEMSYYCFDIN